MTTVRSPTAVRASVAGRVLLGALVQVLALSTWYATSAVSPQLAVHWGLDAAGVSWLTSCVLVGFAAGALVLGLLRAAERVAPAVLLPVGSLVAALCTAVPAVSDLGYAGTLVLRCATGVALAAVYPPGMRVVTSWTVRRRGAAVAVVVAALTLGSALPHLLRTLPLPGWRAVLLAAAAAAVLAAALAVTSRTGPHAEPTGAPVPGSLLRVVRDRRQRLVTTAYLGHMWEVYGLWTWGAALLGVLPGGPLSHPGAGPFLLVGAAGVVGCLAVGSLADRFGRVRVTGAVVAVSAACCLVAPGLPLLPAPVTAVVLLVWGAAVVGDSPVYSALLADATDRSALGTALTVQMALGYSLSVVPVLVLPLLATHVGWPWALLALAPGPLVSAVCLARLRAVERLVPVPGGRQPRAANPSATSAPARSSAASSTRA